ncbi:hypothetical protein PVE_P0184 (plasmid) [Pseudomonas veronii 1YdBTEX2]|uniref:Uncharacterized protein n=1 Tax=Pseudomonas veronii 1YdBTEX2 TaxID=1295141 RepID=A0A1D3KA37_PSEVE|nr:hypothetical protein PVE_P0184 [Pseudomonas veronii 1YdBTEX2]
MTSRGCRLGPSGKPALGFDVELNFPQVLSAPHIMRIILGSGMSAGTVKLLIASHDSWRNASCTAGEYRAKSNASRRSTPCRFS